MFIATRTIKHKVKFYTVIPTPVFFKQPNDAALTNGLIITTLMLLNKSNGGSWQKANRSVSTVHRQQHLVVESVTYLFHTHGVCFNSRGGGEHSPLGDAAVDGMDAGPCAVRGARCEILPPVMSGGGIEAARLVACPSHCRRPPLCWFLRCLATRKHCFICVFVSSWLSKTSQSFKVVGG